MDDELICVECNKPINVKEGGFYDHPKKPMHLECYEETPEGIAFKKHKEELKANPFKEVSDQEPKKKIPQRYCWFHRNDLGEKIPAVCYWYTTDGGSYHACEECGERYGRKGLIHWYGERTGFTLDIIEPFDEDCDHVEYRKSLVLQSDNEGLYDIMACKNCDGQRKRRLGGGI